LTKHHCGSSQSYFKSQIANFEDKKVTACIRYCLCLQF